MEKLHLSEERRKLYEEIGKRPDVVKTLPYDELMKRAKISSEKMIEKNREAYEALAYR